MLIKLQESHKGADVLLWLFVFNSCPFSPRRARRGNSNYVVFFFPRNGTTFQSFSVSQASRKAAHFASASRRSEK